MIHYRVICPVGHGGFAFEKFENIAIVFDCGSDSCPDRVFQYIDVIKKHHVAKIDYLFISHFDNDHVDCISKLINTLHVKEAVVPHIPNDYRIAYNLYTSDAYSQIMNLLRNKDIIVREISEDTIVHKEQDIWEWIAHNQIEAGDWTKLCNEMAHKGIVIASLNNAHYVENNQKSINTCFKKAFGSNGPNAKGLMMLSQRTTNAKIVFSKLFICKDENRYYLYPHIHHYHWICDDDIDGDLLVKSNNTGALYTGDADLISRRSSNLAKGFYDNRKSEDKLILCQIPHHGSRYNSSYTLTSNFPSIYYFYHDCSDVRIKKNLPLFGQLTNNNQLLGLHNVESDIVCGKIEVH